MEGVEEEDEGTTAEGADDDIRLLEILGCEFSFFKKIGAEAFFLHRLTKYRTELTFELRVELSLSVRITTTEFLERRKRSSNIRTKTVVDLFRRKEWGKKYSEEHIMHFTFHRQSIVRWKSKCLFGRAAF